MKCKICGDKNTTRGFSFYLCKEHMDQAIMRLPIFICSPKKLNTKKAEKLGRLIFKEYIKGKKNEM